MKYYDPKNPKPEIVIALCGPAGINLKQVCQQLEETIASFDYHVFQIRVSDLIKGWCEQPVQSQISGARYDNQVRLLMNAADKIREECKTGAATVPLIFNNIRYQRQKFLFQENCTDEYQDIELYNHCFIINSLKHPHEVNFLRHIYGDKFVLISGFEDFSSRVENLIDKIAKSAGKANNRKFKPNAEQIINLDQKKSGTDIGQNL